MIIVLLHVVGSVGTALGYAQVLLPLTPLNLVICAAIVMAFTGAQPMAVVTDHGRGLELKSLENTGVL